MSTSQREREREKQLVTEIAINGAKLSSVLNWECGQFFEPNKR